MKTTGTELWKKYPEIFKAVQQDADIGEGHGSDHDIMVAQTAKKIASSEAPKLSEDAWIAGIIHSTDRRFPEDEVEEKLYQYLALTHLPSKRKKRIVSAVLKHSQKNDDRDDILLKILMDADRYSNIGALVFIRAGQFYHKLSAINPLFLDKVDPESTFLKPKTVHADAFWFAREWRDKKSVRIRTATARKMAEPFFKILEEMNQSIKDQFSMVGLYPWPFD